MLTSKTASSPVKMTETTSKLVLDLATKINQNSGANLSFKTDVTTPITEWIQEKDMAATKPIKLRTARQTKDNVVMKLQQFNPSFFLPEKSEISCRAPGCLISIPREKTSNDSEHIKQDLFLCEIHRTKMANLVSKRCEQEEIFVSVASYKHEDFHGYTNLIDALEKAYLHLVKKPTTLKMPPNNVYPNTDLVLAEVFLNARNFLIITHALLNPNGDNVEVILPGLYVMLERILDLLLEGNRLERLVSM